MSTRNKRPETSRGPQASVNPTLATYHLPMKITGAQPTGSGTLHWLSGPDPEAFNNPGAAPVIMIRTEELAAVNDAVEIPAASACILVLPVH